MKNPNIIVIITDDIGYGDLACYGHPTIATPRLDRMAAEGVRFTQFYSGAAVCTPSRAALLTGRYPVRSGMTRVLVPKSSGGLPASEITIAGALRDAGYATMCVGKWHLGCRREHHPMNHGFDSYFGLPYSNDMSPWAQPENPTFDGDPPHPILRDFTTTNDAEPDQTLLTRAYTDESLAFIRGQAAKNKPFFLYLAHTFPHVPLFAGAAFRGKSRRGLYGDAVEEIDGSCGEILDELARLGIDDETLVVFTSDHGPWLGKKLAGGSPGLFREGKVSTWEGGLRVPFIARWPGRIPAGRTTRAFATAMDLFPTLVGFANGAVPADRPMDGVSLSHVLTEDDGGREPLVFYYFNEEVWGVRKGPWKILNKSVNPASVAGWGNWPVTEHRPPLLFNVETDPSETSDAGAEHPAIVAELQRLIARHVAEVERAPTQN